jgi:hypothetical protein
MRRIQNIVNIQHTDNNKYIKFKVLNIVIKIKSTINSYELENHKIKPSRLLSMRLIGRA